MPIIEDEQLRLDPGSLILNEPKTKNPDPDFIDVAAASFRSENEVSSFIEWVKEGGDKFSDEVDPNFELTDELIEQYPGEKEDLFDVHNQQRYDLMRERVNRQLRDKQVREEGGWVADTTDVIAALSSPTSLIPGGVLVKGGRAGWTIGKLALDTALTAGIATGAQEAMLQATQDLRSGKDTAIAVTGSVVFGGLIGAGVGTLARGRVNKIIDDLEKEIIPDDPDIISHSAVPQRGDVGAAEATTLEEEGLAVIGTDSKVKAGALGLTLSPTVRAARSASKTVRATMARLLDDPLIRVKNLEGKASEVPVEIAVRIREAALEIPVRMQRSEYKKWVKEVRAGNAELPDGIAAPRGQLDTSYETFMQLVGRAMRRSDFDSISPAVSRVARSYRKHVFDPLIKDAVAVGLVDAEDLIVKTADSYLTRMWSVDKMLDDELGFKHVVRNWLKSGDEAFDEDELEQIIDELFIGMTTAPNATMPFFDDMILGKASALKKRVLMIPDDVVEDFIENRADKIAQSYMRSMASEVEFKRAGFSNKQLTDEFGQIDADYETRISRESDPAKQKALGKQWRQDKADLKAAVELLFDAYKKPQDPYAMGWRAVRALKTWNFLTMLGQMTLSAIPDMARVITENGLARSAKGLRAIALSPAVRKMRAAEARKAGTALDLVLANGRFELLADIRDPFSQLSGFERFQNGMATFFGKATGMTHWNVALKQFAGSVTQDRIITDIGKLLSGNLAKGDRSILANMFIDDTMARRIKGMFDEHGEQFNGLWVANTDAWTDQVALRTFRAAVVKHVDLTINTPGKGTSPLWTKGQMGSLIGQFKSFAFAAHQQTTLRGIQKHNASFIYGTLAATALGGVSMELKKIAAGKDAKGNFNVKLPEPGSAEWMIKAIDQSGYFALFGEVNNITDKQFNMSVDRLFGGSQTRPYNIYGKVLPLLGPGASRVEDVIKLGDSTLGGLFRDREWKASDTKRLRRMIWFQNHFALRQLFNEGQDEFNEAIGVR